MGQSKALLPAGAPGSSFVGRLTQSLRDGGITDLLVVGRPEDHALRREVALLGDDVRYVENHRAEEGQISSIVAALDLIDRASVTGLLVVPVDQPLISSGTVATLLEAFARKRAPIARATHHGRHGHPVVFAARLFDELRSADRSVGARAVLRAHASEILDVEVPDAGALIDVDDPEDYERVFGSRPC